MTKHTILPATKILTTFAPFMTWFPRTTSRFEGGPRSQPAGTTVAAPISTL